MPPCQRVPHMSVRNEDAAVAPSFRRPPATSGDVKSALRVIQVLDLLGQWGSARTHVQIAEELNIPKSSLTQVLKTLLRHDYLSIDAEIRGYLLGPAITDLAGRSRGRRDLSEAAAPVLEWVTEQTGESSALNLREGDHHRVAATVLSPHRIVAHLRLGDRAPLHATSGGQVILANLPEPMREEYLARARYQRFARNSLLSAEAVRDKLQAIAAAGYATVEEEYTPGIGGIARVILSPQGRPLASLSVTVPTERMTDALRETALGVIDRAVTMLKHRAGLTQRAAEGDASAELPHV
ncbi:IclR family transcriptional regulator [Alloyangia mangrovi]|uniref:IclR family transcriptional regulator n=2 Tax=Alloyangia mangrovi TaxID=1779329 RepID=A0A2A3JXX8_9RHOB|nr:IclR family transcriptional regulator [Alloyangia mangrovi]